MGAAALVAVPFGAPAVGDVSGGGADSRPPQPAMMTAVIADDSDKDSAARRLAPHRSGRCRCVADAAEVPAGCGSIIAC